MGMRRCWPMVRTIHSFLPHPIDEPSSPRCPIRRLLPWEKADVCSTYLDDIRLRASCQGFLNVALFFIWHPPTSTPSAPGITQQNFSGTSSNTASSTGDSTSTSGDIHVYVVGAVKHPGVYTLPAGARVYQLLQAAGGALSNANLVALNLAASLTDGEEVYVIVNGEIPPAYQGGVPGPGTNGTATTGQPVNINTASVAEMHQNLHISSTTAQNIVNYRQQHGPYTSIDQLQQVVSKSIYEKIKNLVTI